MDTAIQYRRYSHHASLPLLSSNTCDASADGVESSAISLVDDARRRNVLVLTPVPACEPLDVLLDGGEVLRRERVLRGAMNARTSWLW